MEPVEIKNLIETVWLIGIPITFLFYFIVRPRFFMGYRERKERRSNLRFYAGFGVFFTVAWPFYVCIFILSFGWGLVKKFLIWTLREK